MDSKQQDTLLPQLLPPPPPLPRADETLQILDLENMDLTLTSSDLAKSCKELSCYTTDLSSVGEMDMAFVDSYLDSSRNDLSRFDLSKRQSSKYELSKFEFSKLEISKQEQSSQETSIPELAKDDEIPKYESSILELPKQNVSTNRPDSPVSEEAKKEIDFELTKFNISDREPEPSDQETSQHDSSIIQMPKEETSNHDASILEVLEQVLSKQNSIHEAPEDYESKQEVSVHENSVKEMAKQESPTDAMSKPDLIEFFTPAKPALNLSTPSPFTFMINKFSKLALATPPASTPNKPWPIPNKNLMTPFNPTTPTEDVSSIDLIQFSLDESKLETSIQATNES